MNYAEFLEQKKFTDHASGLPHVDPTALNPFLFDFQRDIVAWALRRGRSAIFADCGMGKTLMQLSWCAEIVRVMGGRVLVVAPLAVGPQTVEESGKFGIRPSISFCKTGSAATQIVVTNYDSLHKFNPADFVGIVIDESSILKSYTGKFRNMLIDQWGNLQFRLACTATPAPNDFMELGNHAEFLGAMTRAEMLAHFFVHDGGETQQWRLKGHAESEFWKWLCSWAVMIRKPSDLGYDDAGFSLPDMEVIQHTVDSSKTADGFLFALDAHSLSERLQARKVSLEDRTAEVARLVNASSDPWLVWCNLNSESDALVSLIPGAVAVSGGDDPDVKTARLMGFAHREFRVMVSKPRIAGWGMNYQHCANVAFTGLSDSYEEFYQAVRRCWRFGQTRNVAVHVVTARTEGAVVANIRRKEDDATRMAREMVEHMADISSTEIRGTVRMDRSYNPKTTIKLPSFA
jgi:hypothetical protein